MNVTKKLLLSILLVFCSFPTFSHAQEHGSGSMPTITTNDLNNPNATLEAKNLMKYIKSEVGQHILSGQMDNGNATTMYQKTGKYPAILGLDMYDYSSVPVAMGKKSSQVEKAIAYHDKGGIITFMWHWIAPNMTNKSKWASGEFTKNTSFDVQAALNNPSSKEYQMIIKDIDLIAAQLKRLQDKKIPILFRPLHEAEGGWFWWGAKGPEPAKKLYRLMYDRITNYHHINNLIWVWSSVKSDWYPGDNVVDIAAYDSYVKSVSSNNTASSKYQQLYSLVKGNKPIAMSENDKIPDPDLLKKDGLKWSYFMTWRDEDNLSGSFMYNTDSYLKKVYNHNYVITRDELPKGLF